MIISFYFRADQARTERSVLADKFVRATADSSNSWRQKKVGAKSKSRQMKMSQLQAV